MPSISSLANRKLVDSYGRRASWSAAEEHPVDRGAVVWLAEYRRRSAPGRTRASDADKRIARLTRRVDDLTRLLLAQMERAQIADAQGTAHIESLYDKLRAKRTELPKVQFTVEEIKDIFSEE